MILLYFNYRKKLFLGNNGSSILSAMIAVALVESHNSNSVNFSAEVIFIILLIPGIDMARLFILRIINRKNTFEGDN